MLQSLHAFKGYAIEATDGNLGKVDEFYFDDQTWDIRYLVVETGNWMESRDVLISVAALGTPDWTNRTFPLHLTREQVRNSPPIDTESPVHRHHEMILNSHYQWPIYWEGLYPDSFGLPSFPGEETMRRNEQEKRIDDGTPHLQSTRIVGNYRLSAIDGEMGHVEDFIADTMHWKITDMVVSAGKWHLGKKVLIPVNIIESFDDELETVQLDCTRSEIRHHREYDPLKPVMPQEETWMTHA